MKEKTIDTNHLLLAILKDDNNYATRYLVENGITYNKVKQEISESQPENQADFPGDEDDEAKGPFGSGGPGGGPSGRIERRRCFTEIQFRYPGIWITSGST
jgi:ATP-dependent Clp protease ATP-binding subunit ClpC